MLREVPQGPQPGLWGSWRGQCHHACPSVSLPTPGVPGELMQELSARGMHPPARGWSSVGMGTTIHTWCCCVSGPQTDPTAPWGRSGPGMSLHSCQEQQGFGGVQAGEQQEHGDDGGAERRWWELLLCPVGSLLSPSSSWAPQALSDPQPRFAAGSVH